MTTRLMLLVFLTSCVVGPAGADARKLPATGLEPRQVAEEAMGFIAMDDMAGFMAMVRRKMPMPAGDIEKIEATLKSQRKEVISKLGKSLGYALVNECHRTDMLLRLIYAEKREKNVLRWQFIFYKPRDKWLWSYFYWDGDAQQLFAPCS
jgi:hypothetical protein